MKYKNLESIKKQSVQIYNLLKNIKESSEKEFGLDSNGSGSTLYYLDKEKVYLSSVEHVSVESELLVNEALEGEYDEIIVFGIGSFEFLKRLLDNKSKYARIHLIEYDWVMSLLLNNVNLKKIRFDQINSLTLLHEDADIALPLFSLFQKSTMKIRFFVLPQYERLFPEEVKKYRDQFISVLDDKRGSIRVNKAYEKLWIVNSIINFKHVISTPNFFDIEDSGHDFSNSSVIIVGAGPSLNRDMDLLKKIAKSGKCYIVAIGSSYRTLLRNNVEMDVIFSYDPTSMNVEVLNDYHSEKSDTLLCFGSSISFEAIRSVNYDNTSHILISQDYFSKFLLQDSKTKVIVDAPSVANIALMAVLELGFNKVYFAGMDMSYSGNQVYAEGIDSERIKKRKNMPNKVHVENVFGVEVETTKGLLASKNGIELVVEKYKDRSFINTTYGGAMIKGARFLELENVDFSVYDDKVSFRDLLQPNKYDVKKAGTRFQEMLDERTAFINMLNHGFRLLFKLKEDLDAKNEIEISRITDFEKLYNDFVDNKYYSVLLSKLDRIYVNYFQNSVIEINREENINNKFALLYKRMGTILMLFKQSDESIFKLFVYISKWIVWE